MLLLKSHHIENSLCTKNETEVGNLVKQYSCQNWDETYVATHGFSRSSFPKLCINRDIYHRINKITNSSQDNQIWRFEGYSWFVSPFPNKENNGKIGNSYYKYDDKTPCLRKYELYLFIDFLFSIIGIKLCAIQRWISPDVIEFKTEHFYLII